MSFANRARDNREYVRTLLKKKEPEFAALLDWLEREVPCLTCQDTTCDATGPASGTARTAASVQVRLPLAVMLDRRPRAMLIESGTGPSFGPH
jgi:hypothetical protein